MVLLLAADWTHTLGVAPSDVIDPLSPKLDGCQFKLNSSAYASLDGVAFFSGIGSQSMQGVDGLELCASHPNKYLPYRLR